MTGLHHHAVLSRHDFGLVRIGGPGLGNLLFPIGRALVGRELLGGTFVYPTMRQFKIGPYLRRELDKRTYGRVLRGRTVAEWRAWLSARSLPSVGEDTRTVPEGPATVCYEGVRRYFHDLQGHGELMRGWLSANAYPGRAETRPFDIAIHVRLGDFAVRAAAGGNPSIRLPMDWYRSALKEARGLAGTMSPSIVLFTDGEVEAVRRELELAGIGFDVSRDALSAILRLSCARVLVASRSTFSMWGTFLGEGAAVWDGRFDLATFFPRRLGRDVTI